MSTDHTSKGMAHLEHLLTRDIRVIRVIHADLFGRQRGKQVPIDALQMLLDGVAYSKISLAEDLLGVPVDEDEFPRMKGHPDLHAVVEAGTAIIPPWEPDALWVLAGLWENGERSALCARGQLATARERLEHELGYTAVAAGEPEFYLFESGGQRKPYATDGVSYTIDRITDPRGVVGRMHRALADFGIGVTTVNREYSPGQFEINLRHSDVESAADQAFLLKTAIKELAIIEGTEAVFMPKPLVGEEGSGLHVHMSLWQGAQNVFDDGNGGMTPIMRSAIAGVQLHAPALMAFAAPIINSYKRLRGEGLSPRTSNFAEDNRHTYVRVPAERGNATRFEVRIGDASASPHLLMAAILHAARDGILRGLEPTKDGMPLPRSLESSLIALENSEVLIDGFGDELVRAYTAIKRREIEAYEATVTEWEWDLYHSHA